MFFFTELRKRIAIVIQPAHWTGWGTQMPTPSEGDPRRGVTAMDKRLTIKSKGNSQMERTRATQPSHPGDEEG